MQALMAAFQRWLATRAGRAAAAQVQQQGLVQEAAWQALMQRFLASGS